MKGIIGLPHTGQLPIEFVKSLLKLDMPEGAQLFDVPKSAIHVAREMLVMRMMKDPECEWILFIDDDMVFPPETLKKLLAHNVPVATAMAFKRIAPYAPCFYQSCDLTDDGLKIEPYDLDEKPTKPFPAEAAGAACLLIRREVFEAIKYPWFLPLPFTGEDISFSLKLKKEGIPILVDPDLVVGHLETRAIDIYTYLEHKSRLGGAL